MKVLNLSDIPFASLITFRKRERNEANGFMYRDLRHRYSERLNLYVEKLASAKDGASRDTLVNEFEADMHDDLDMLKQELRGKWSGAAFSKEMIVPIVTTAAIAAAHFHGLPLSPPIPDVFSVAGIPITAAGALSVTSKFARERLKTLQAHPIAYLYELKGGMRW